MTTKSSFRSLLEMSDKIAREELGDYYIISSTRMENYLNCLADGANQIHQLLDETSHQRKKIDNLSRELDDMRQSVGIAYDVGAGRAEQSIEVVARQAFQAGRDSLKSELIDWLTNGFEYENSVMTVHSVREVLNRYTQKENNP